MAEYQRGVDIARRPWQRRIEVYSPKLGRRVTFFSQAAREAWLLLESDPTVKRFCERPEHVGEAGGRVIDFWVDTGRRESFWLIETGEERHEAWPKKLHGLSLRVMRSEELLAHSTRIRNWSQIVPYLVSFTRYQNRTLQQDLLHRLAKPYRLHGLEKEFHPVDTAAVRAALFALLAAGKVVAPELERVALSGQSLFRRVSR